MTDQPRLELADYLLAAEIEKHITVEPEDSVRADWWRASCGIHEWYATGSQSVVEDAAAHHVAWEHRPCAAPSDLSIIDTLLYCRLLPGHVDDHANGRYTWPQQPDPVPVDDHANDYARPQQPNPGTEHATAAAPPHRERYVCPISTCYWVFDAPPPPAVDPATLADVFGPGTMTNHAIHNYRANIERILNEHFSRHHVVEYVTEITNLRNLNTGLVKQLQQLGAALGDLLKRTPDLRHDVDPAALLSAVITPTKITGP